MSTQKSDSGGNSSESVYGSYSFIHDHILRKGNTSRPDLGPAAKRWLKHQGLGKDYCHDQQNVLDAEFQLLGARRDNRDAKASGEKQLIEEFYATYPQNDAAFSSDEPLKHFYKDNADIWLQEFESTLNDELLPDAHLVDLDSYNCLLFERPKKLCSDLDSQWIELKKIEPWWHAADRDDLASLVTQTSSHHIRKCDSPGGQSMYVEKFCDNCNHFKEQMTDKEAKASHVADCTPRNVSSVEDREVSYTGDCTEENLASAPLIESLGESGLVDCTLQESDRTFSSREGFNKAKVDPSDTQELASGNLRRAELLEALCHSQTRARQAEKLAQEACDEKDHVINIFFQQASCLFAYRQWLRMLQLETLCLHLRSTNQLSSFTTCAVLPRVQSKGITLRKNRPSAAKKKPGKQKGYISRCAVAFAVGLGLGGAGLLVGWTIGWLFSAL